jgi:hypothetical protein
VNLLKEKNLLSTSLLSTTMRAKLIRYSPNFYMTRYKQDIQIFYSLITWVLSIFFCKAPRKPKFTLLFGLTLTLPNSPLGVFKLYAPDIHLRYPRVAVARQSDSALFTLGLSSSQLCSRSLFPLLSILPLRRSSQIITCKIVCFLQ